MLRESAGSTAADTKIIVKGDVPRVKHIGHGMKAGEIVIEGSSGMHVGSEMIGGSIVVKGRRRLMGWHGDERRDFAHNRECRRPCWIAYRGSWRGMNGGSILIDVTPGASSEAE